MILAKAGNTPTPTFHPLLLVLQHFGKIQRSSIRCFGIARRKNSTPELAMKTASLSLISKRSRPTSPPGLEGTLSRQRGLNRKT